MTLASRHNVIRLTALLAMMLASARVVAQDLVLTGNIVNNGTINVNRNIINNAATPVTVGGTGTVALTGNGATQHNIQGNDSISFNKLDLRGSRIATMQVGVVVWNGLRIGYAGNAYTAGTTGFSVGTRRLAIGSTSSYDAASTAALTFGGGTVRFFGSAAQAILNRSLGVTYGTLDLTGAGTKTITAGGKVVAATLTQAGGALTVSESLAVTGTATLAAVNGVAATKSFALTAASTAGSIASYQNAQTGTLQNAGAGTLTITAMTGNSGTINQSGSGATTFSGNIVNTGTITAGAGTINLQGTGAQTNTGGTISLTGNSALAVSGDLAANPGTLTFAVTSTVSFTGAAQNLPAGVTYGTLIAGGTGAKTANNNITVASGLTLNQNLSMAPGILTMTSTTAANVTGSGEVTGSVRRFHAFTAGQSYLFHRTDVSIGTATTAGTDITLTMSPVTDPSGTLPTNQYVRRRYAIVPSVAGALQSVSLHYAAGELQNGVIESKLGLRRYNGAAWAKVTNAGQIRTAGGGTVSYTGLNNSLAGFQELGLFRIDFVTSANGANISLAAGWDENTLPDATDDGLINHTGVVTGAVPVSLRTLTINAGRDLNTAGVSGVTVQDSTMIDGTLTVSNADVSTSALRLRGTSGVTIASGRTVSSGGVINSSTTAMTWAGNLQAASLTNNAGSALTLNGGSNAVTGAVANSGSLTVGGILTAAAGSVQTVVNTGTLSVNGPAALFTVGQAGVASGLRNDLTGQIQVGATAHLQVFGDLQVIANANVINAGLVSVGE